MVNFFISLQSKDKFVDINKRKFKWLEIYIKWNYGVEIIV